MFKKLIFLVVLISISLKEQRTMSATIDDFLVNDDTGSTIHFSPQISTDSSGSFVITWEDYRNSDQDVYAQRYGSSGIALGPNFRVNDDSGSHSEYDPSISMNMSGDFVIAWDGYAGIWAQRYSSAGIAVGPNFIANDDTGNWQHPAVCIARSGRFVITWQDERLGNWDIYAQKYDSAGTPLGSNFRINDDTGSSEQGYPEIGMDSSGAFVITWHDSRDGLWNTYAQRFGFLGARLGSNFRVSDSGAATPTIPKVTVNNRGSFAVTWIRFLNRNRVYAQRYGPQGEALGSNFSVTSDGSHLGISMGNSGSFVITWEGNQDIYAQRYDSSGTPVGSAYMVSNPLYASFIQRYPAVNLNNHRIYFAWEDNRRGNIDIYAKVCYFIRGDVNGDDKLNIADIVYLVSYLFKHGPAPVPELGVGDTNCDGKTTIGDVVYLVSYLFKHGPQPCQ